MSRTPSAVRPAVQPAAVPRHRLALAAVVAGLALAGCSSAGQMSSEGADDSGAAADASAEEPEAAADALSDRKALDSDVAARSVSADDGAAAPDPTVQPAVIQTGSMTVESDDVGRARFELGKVVDTHEGTIADEKTTASSEGEVRLSRLVLRVPSGDFDAAMADLARLGEVTGSTRKAEDVTGEVIDTRARIRAQEQSLARVEVLFSRARTIRDVVAVEAQLSRRQADLDSLKGQLAWLEDQTSLSTITVYLEQAPEPRSAAAADDDSAFVAGLRNGWHALVAVGGGLATVAGALLPFAVVALALGVPVLVLLRRWLARHPWRRPAAEV